MLGERGRRSVGRRMTEIARKCLRKTKPWHPRAKALSCQELGLGSPMSMKTCRVSLSSSFSPREKLSGQRSVHMGKFSQ